MAHEIVNRIFIEGELVYVMGSPADRRPLTFDRRVDPAYTLAFQQEGLYGLMAAIARDIHRGSVRLRAGSLINRALRRGLHAIGLERFQAMEEGLAVGHLAAMAERVMGNWDHDPAEDLPELERALLEREGEG